MSNSLLLKSSGVMVLAIALSSCASMRQTLGNLPIVPSLLGWPDACLPEGRQIADIVSAQVILGTTHSTDVQRVTVEQTLRELGAHCQAQTLIDRTGREIRFYQLEGCWGNPPINAKDIMQEQADKIQKLRQTYIVVEMTCNPTGTPYSRLSQPHSRAIVD